jgi:hypothetical protein
MDGDGQCVLFTEADSGGDCLAGFEEADIALIAALHSSAGPDFFAFPPGVRRLYELSVNAFTSIIYARIS